MRRGQLWARGGQEAYLVVSTDALNNTRTIVWGLLVADDNPGVDYPLAVPVPLDSDTQPQLWIRATQIRTINADALTDHLGTLDTDTMAKVDEAILRLADLDRIRTIDG